MTPQLSKDLEVPTTISINRKEEVMQYIIIELDNAYYKFEIDKSHLAKVKSGDFDMIIDTENKKVFRKETQLFGDDIYDWFDIKSYDKRFES